MVNFSLLSNTEKIDSCILRKYFDGLGGEFTQKSINFVNLEGIVDIEKRPEYSQTVFLNKFKKLADNVHYAFLETINTNKEFLNSFKGFLRANAEEVEAENFEEIPKSHRTWYSTPFSPVPVDTYETGIMLQNPGESPRLISHKEVFKGVDYSRNMTLRMIKPETIDEKINNIEKETNFSALILHIVSSRETLEALETKMGKIHYGVTRI